MTIQVNLCTFLDVSIFFEDRIQDACRKTQRRKLAFAPANAAAAEATQWCHAQGYEYEQIFVYDKNPGKDFPFPVHPFDAVLENAPDQACIVSGIHNEAIKKRLISLGIHEEAILECSGAETSLLSLEKAAAYIETARNHNNEEILARLCGENELAIIHSPGFFYDMLDKLAILTKDMNMLAIWLDPAARKPCHDEDLGAIRANFIDIIHFLRSRGTRKNVIFLSLTPAWHLVVPCLVRRMLVDLPIIAYMYEWLPCHFPSSDPDFFRNITGQSDEYLAGEREAFNQIISGGIIDGLIYKHGGKSFRLMDNYPKPSLCFPPCLSRQLYQSTPPHQEALKRIVFLGAVPSVDENSELYHEARIIGVFRHLLDQGFTIDVYDPRNSNAQSEFTRYLGHRPGIRFLPGAPLDTLLPKISGQYGWGFMLFDNTRLNTFKEHVSIAIPAKIFSYLALGTPILVTKEHGYSAELVETHKIGMTIASGDIPRLNEILANAHYETLRANVLTFRETMALEDRKEEFASFIRLISRGTNEAALC
ncbi:MAG: hypothetical protein ACOY3Z_02195 [Thermodesulfobacteriota bacterium]